MSDAISYPGPELDELVRTLMACTPLHQLSNMEARTVLKLLLQRGCRIEPALNHLRKFLDAIALISETMEEPAASAVNVIVHAALEHVTEADEAYGTLFKLGHPDRERFERDGWRGEAA